MLYRATRRVQVDQREFEPGDRVTFTEGREHLAEELLKLGAIEPVEGMFEPLGAVEQIEDGGQSSPVIEAISAAIVDGALTNLSTEYQGGAGKVTGGEHTPVAADPGATTAPNTAGAAVVAHGGAGTEGAAAPTAKASDEPAVPPAAGRRPRSTRKSKAAPATPKAAS